MEPRDRVLVTAAELAALLEAGDPLTILDVRWRLDEPDGHPAYLQGHLPGAVYVSLEDELSDHTVTGRGRHPLPSGRSVETSARRWGIRQGGPTVGYDERNRAGSGRAWMAACQHAGPPQAAWQPARLRRRRVMRPRCTTTCTTERCRP